MAEITVSEMLREMLDEEVKIELSRKENVGRNELTIYYATATVDDVSCGMAGGEDLEKSIRDLYRIFFPDDSSGDR